MEKNKKNKKNVTSNNKQVDNNKKNKSTKAKETDNVKLKKEIKTKQQSKEMNIKEKEIVNKSKDNSLTSNDEVTKLMKIILSVTAIFLVFYGVTVLVTEKNDDEDTNEITIQYDEILLGTLFNQQNEEYYVLVTQQEDEYVNAYLTYVNMYKQKENSIRMYTSNLDSAFNKSFFAEQSNTKVNNVNDLKLKSSTLIKINNKSIVAVYEGSNSIIEHLKSLVK